MRVLYRVVSVTREWAGYERERVDMRPEDQHPRWTITKPDGLISIFLHPDDWGKFKVGDLVPISIG